MTREQLEHAIRAACDIADEEYVIVFGSQAILGKYPDASPHLRQSVEVDIAPGSNDPFAADRIDGVAGEASQFHATHGFYIHGLTLESAILPLGWERRTVAVDGAAGWTAVGRCIEAHDLAASKLAAFREKDRDFVRTLLLERLIRPQKLRHRIGRLPQAQVPVDRLFRWLDATLSELPRPGSGG